MYRIMNSSSRTFIVGSDDVLKGGEKFESRQVAGKKIMSVRLHPGKEIFEVTDKLGKELSTYQGIIVVEAVKETKKGK